MVCLNPFKNFEFIKISVVVLGKFLSMGTSFSICMFQVLLAIDQTVCSLCIQWLLISLVVATMVENKTSKLSIQGNYEMISLN